MGLNTCLILSHWNPWCLEATIWEIMGFPKLLFLNNSSHRKYSVWGSVMKREDVTWPCVPVSVPWMKSHTLFNAARSPGQGAKTRGKVQHGNQFFFSCPGFIVTGAGGGFCLGKWPDGKGFHHSFSSTPKLNLVVLRQWYLAFIKWHWNLEDPITDVSRHMWSGSWKCTLFTGVCPKYFSLHFEFASSCVIFPSCFLHPPNFASTAERWALCWKPISMKYLVLAVLHLL